MRKNRFCTFTLISALMIAALPSTLAIAGNEQTTVSAAQSIPEQKTAKLTISPSGADNGYKPDGSKFTAYRVMSLSQTNGTDWTWEMVNGFQYPGTDSFNPDNLDTYPAAKMQDMADRLALQVKPEMSDKLDQATLSEGSCSWTTSDLGIYLVCETETAAGNFPSAPFLVSLPYTNEDGNSWNYEVTAHPKGSTVGLEKQITNAKGSHINEVVYRGDKDTVARGDEVNYEITTRIPRYTDIYFDGKNPTFRLTDTIAKGLTLKKTTVSLKAGDQTLINNTDYTQSLKVGDGGQTVLTINMTASFLENTSNHNKDLSLTYTASVNDDASLSDDGNDNVVQLAYSYDPADPENTKTVEDDATVYTFGIQIEKFNGDKDGQTKEKLSGAQFALYKEKTKGGTAAEALSQDACRPVGVTDENGALSFQGLDAGTYYLKEVKAPSGYSLLTKPIKVQIIPTSTAAEGAEVITGGGFTAKVNDVAVTDATTEGTSRILTQDNREGTVIVSAANHKGFSLPMTGGSGITLILMIAAAGLLAVTVFFVKGDGEKASSSGSDQV